MLLKEILFFNQKVSQANATARKASVATHGSGCGRGNQLEEFKWQQKLQESMLKGLASFAVTAGAQEHCKALSHTGSQLSGGAQPLRNIMNTKIIMYNILLQNC